MTWPGEKPIFYLLRLKRSGEFSGESIITPATTDGQFVFTKSETYMSFHMLLKATMAGVHRDPDMYGLHSPKVWAVVALAEVGAYLFDVEARVGFSQNIGMAERYSRKSLKGNGD